MNRFICANCGKEIDDCRGVFCILDNFLQVAYFDDNRSNRFCSPECACEAMSGEWLNPDEVPLDEEEAPTKDCYYTFISERQREEFESLFPFTDPEDIPASVWEDVLQGVPLVASYALYLKQLENK